jgi:hypothetical protein
MMLAVVVLLAVAAELLIFLVKLPLRIILLDTNSLVLVLRHNTCAAITISIDFFLISNMNVALVRTIEYHPTKSTRHGQLSLNFKTIVKVQILTRKYANYRYSNGSVCSQTAKTQTKNV